MTKDNKKVHGLWIGRTLSNIEILTMKSFIKHGHDFYLWVYDDIITPVPEGVIVRDATEIIPRHQVFYYKKYNQWGEGKGSYAGFSDIFRYKLLYEYGGWWVDMDITLLKPLDFSDPYVFRNHDKLPVVGNVLKCPPKSALMLDCYNKAIAEVDENNTDWFRPIQILNDFIKEHHLMNYIKYNISNIDSWDITRLYTLRNKKVPEAYYIIHWQNEVWRSKGLDKNCANRFSTLGKLMKENEIENNKCTCKQLWFFIASYIPVLDFHKYRFFFTQFYHRVILWFYYKYIKWLYYKLFKNKFVLRFYHNVIIWLYFRLFQNRAVLWFYYKVLVWLYYKLFKNKVVLFIYYKVIKLIYYKLFENRYITKISEGRKTGGGK